MKLEVTELGPFKRALKIEVPEDEVNRRFTQAYADLNRQVLVGVSAFQGRQGPACRAQAEDEGRCGRDEENLFHGTSPTVRMLNRISIGWLCRIELPLGDRQT